MFVLPIFVLFVCPALFSNERAVDMFWGCIYSSVECNRLQDPFARLYP